MPRPRIRKRLTSVSLPVVGGGVGWENLPDVEKEVLARLVAFLEDRRVLYNPLDIEILDHCVVSVIEIRRHLVDEIGRLPRDVDLAVTLRRMAAACRAFLDEVQRGLRSRRWGGPVGWGPEFGALHEALGKLRGQLGLYLQELIDHHGVQITGELVSILPPPPDTEP